MSHEITRSIQHHQDLVLVVLLALDTTGHGLAEGSIGDLADMSCPAAIVSLQALAMVRRHDTAGSLELTDSGRAEARLAAMRIAGCSS
jgi:hypothetical protein